MRAISTRSKPRRILAAAILAAVAAAVAGLPARAADHRDGPIFGPPGITITSSRRDINDVFVFRSPANANNTVLVMNVSPFAGATTPSPSTRTRSTNSGSPTGT
jgi:hypothetical protein